MAQILAIDDSRTTLRYLCRILEGAGHVVSTVTDANEGLNLIADNKLDCVICDLLMPGTTGIDFLKQIKSSHPEIPVIISTADVQNTTRSECLDLGAVELINKPADAEELCAAIELAISGEK